MLVVVAPALAGCGRTTTPRNPSSDDVEAYSTVLRAVLELPDAPVRSADERPRVFVEPLDDVTQLPLDVQVGIVAALKEVAELRFIDERTEAIDDELPGAPVRDGGVLVALGPIVRVGESERTVTVRRATNATAATTVTAALARSEAGWAVRRVDPV